MTCVTGFEFNNVPVTSVIWLCLYVELVSTLSIILNILFLSLAMLLVGVILSCTSTDAFGVSIMDTLNDEARLSIETSIELCKAVDTMLLVSKELEAGILLDGVMSIFTLWLISDESVAKCVETKTVSVITGSEDVTYPDNISDELKSPNQNPLVRLPRYMSESKAANVDESKILDGEAEMASGLFMAVGESIRESSMELELGEGTRLSPADPEKTKTVVRKVNSIYIYQLDCVINNI